MAFPIDQLFLDRFIAYNKVRYKDEPSFVAKLESLTLQTIQFTNFRKEDTGDGKSAHLVDVNSPGILTGVNQKYLPARYGIDGVAELQEETPVTMEELQQKSVEGIYLLALGADETSVALLVHKGDKTLENIKALLKEKCLFDLTDDQITVSGNMSGALIDSRTIVGEIGIVESLFDEIARYDGQYRYDGTISY